MEFALASGRVSGHFLSPARARHSKPRRGARVRGLRPTATARNLTPAGDEQPTPDERLPPRNARCERWRTTACNPELNRQCNALVIEAGDTRLQPLPTNTEPNPTPRSRGTLRVRTREDGSITSDVSRCEALPRQSTANPPPAAWLARHLHRPNCERGLISRGAFVVAAAVNRSIARDVGLRKACSRSRQRCGVRIAMTLDDGRRVGRSG